MASRPDDERIHPRAFLVNPEAFGHDPAATWHPLAADVALPHLIAAYWQHLAVCAIRSTYGPHAVDELARRTGTNNVVYLRRRLSGEYRVPIEELCAWAIALDDVSVLPHFDSAADLWPPGSRQGT